MRGPTAAAAACKGSHKLTKHWKTVPGTASRDKKELDQDQLLNGWMHQRPLILHIATDAVATLR